MHEEYIFMNKLFTNYYFIITIFQLSTWAGTAVNPTENPDKILPKKKWWTYFAKAIIIHPEQRGIAASWSDPLLPIKSIKGPDTKAPIGVAKLCTEAVNFQFKSNYILRTFNSKGTYECSLKLMSSNV